MKAIKRQVQCEHFPASLVMSRQIGDVSCYSVSKVENRQQHRQR